jgi:serine/threonine-protein kinase
MYHRRVRGGPVRIANRYELGVVVGSGGFATVYRAKDGDRDVAVKVMPSANAEVVERFRLEALALSQLQSPNVARVFDFGRDDEHGLYLVMELIEGVALEPAKLGRVLLAHEVLRAARALLAGLAEAHAARIVHRDVKPANVLVPHGIAGLADLKILDFGIAQSEHRAILEGLATKKKSGKALGTPAYMAPELLVGEPSSPASDVYAVGLVLFELLGNTTLFPDHAARDQLKMRTERDPVLGARVPAPLDAMLARMLARDPTKRFVDAGEALADLVNMETAPVDIAAFAPPAVPSAPPSRRSRSMPPPPYSRPPLGTMRMSRLDDDAVRALRTTLHALDVPMLEALARRERGSEIGRVARALSLGLRLEIDASALVLEPFSDRTDLACAVAVCLLAPRARVATKARIERNVAQRPDWIDTVDLEMGELLVALEAAICGPEEISRCLVRCERLLARDKKSSASRLTLELAQTALSARSRGATREGVESWNALAEADASPASPLSSVLRALMLGALAFRVDDHASRASFERAAQIASDAGATLLEVRSLVSWGGMLVEVPGRVAQAILVLERVTTLLLHADVPSLEHMAAHNLGAAFIVEGSFDRAARQFHRAREVASGETPLEFEILSGAQELTARLAAGDLDAATSLARLLRVSRNVPVAPRESMLVAIALSLARFCDDDLAGARADLATAHAHADAAGDAQLFSGALEIVYAACANESVDYLAAAADLHKTAEANGFAAFYWFDALRAIATHLPNDAMRAVALHAIDRLVVLLAPAKTS